MSTAIVRVRVEPKRKARAEKILSDLGVTPTQAVNMLYAQIERRKAIPFPVALDDNHDILPSDEHYASVMRLIDK